GPRPLSARGPETGTTGSHAAVLGLVEQWRGISVHQGKNIVAAGDEFGLMVTQQSVGPGRRGRGDGYRESGRGAGPVRCGQGGGVWGSFPQRARTRGHLWAGSFRTARRSAPGRNGPLPPP